VLRVRNFKRTKHYDWLRKNKGRNPRVSYHKVVAAGGRIIDTQNVYICIQTNQETK